MCFTGNALIFDRKFVEVGQVFEQSSNLTGAEMASIFIYEGICGIKQDGNKSLFGVDPGAPNRLDKVLIKLLISNIII